MPRRFGVGIVGLSATGGWAKRAHLPALRELNDRFEIVGLCGSTRDAAAAAAAAAAFRSTPTIQRSSPRHPALI